jgi:hypothetical protein
MKLRVCRGGWATGWFDGDQFFGCNYKQRIANALRVFLRVFWDLGR